MITKMFNLAEVTPNKLVDLVPSTRYQGSKRRILPWLYDNFKKLEFETVLDGFGGTASVSYLFKLMGKRVTVNDILKANYQSGIALIENDQARLDDADITFLITDNSVNYPRFIQDTFQDIYYTEQENHWLDMISYNIILLSERYTGNLLRIKKALAYHALSQAALSKRPFNLFHRKNLNLRTSRVDRSFGNKETWDADFSQLFRHFCKEISEKTFTNGRKNEATCMDIMSIEETKYDLVYFDPPYSRPSEKLPKDYFSLYHFLEGIVDYQNWPCRIDVSKRNKCFVKQGNEWDSQSPLSRFERLFRKFQNSIIAVSYGDPGNPSVEEIKRLLREFKREIIVAKKEYSYKLNRSNAHGMYEVLFVGK